MNTILMNSENSKTSDLHRLYLTDKIDLRRKDKYTALLNLSISYTWKYIKKSYKSNKFKISAPTWNEEFELTHGSFSISDIEDYFEDILKKHGEKAVNPSIKIYLNKIENRIKFKIKTGHYLELLAPKTLKLLRSTKRQITKNENDENVPYLEIIEVVLIHCNVVNNSYQQNSRALYISVPNKSFGQLLDISLKNFIFLKTFDSEISNMDVWFTDQNWFTDKINNTLVVN